jgi:hypothetical protein
MTVIHKWEVVLVCACAQESEERDTAKCVLM